MKPTTKNFLETLKILICIKKSKPKWFDSFPDKCMCSEYLCAGDCLVLCTQALCFRTISFAQVASAFLVVDPRTFLRSLPRKHKLAGVCADRIPTLPVRHCLS